MSNIQSIERASKLLGLFSVNRPRLGISEISRELELAKGTVQGLVRTLANEGLLSQDVETKKYQLGAKVYELGTIFGKSLDVNQKALVFADEIARRQKLIVRIGIWDRGSVLITLTTQARIGSVPAGEFALRVPAYCTGMGKSLLAFLDQREMESYIEQTELNAYTPNTITDKNRLREELELTKTRGYATNKEEHWLRRGAIAAPIFGRNNSLVASMAFVGDPTRFSGEEKDKLSIELMETAREISELMGYAHPHDRYLSHR
jgi:DNA-binding IclR family transcriptional regulator